MPRLRLHYHDGPLDRRTEDVDRPALEADLSRQIAETDTWHHYALVDPLPDLGGDEPFPLHYKHVTEFDPSSDYLKRVAERRLTDTAEGAGPN